MAIPRKLNPKQKLFVEEYLVDLNGAQAAIRAGYSTKRARITASNLLAHPMIKAALKQALDEQKRRIQVSREQVLHELSLIAFSDITNYEVEASTGELRTRASVSPDARRAVSSLKTKIRTRQALGVIETETEFRLWDKNAALTLLAKHFGIAGAERHLDIDVSKLTNDELKRVRDGEDPIDVIISSRLGGG